MTALPSPKSKTLRIDRVPDDRRIELDPFAVGAASGLLWRGGGRTLAGIGELTRIPVGRPAGFASAMEELAGMVGADEVEQPGSGPVGFASFAFDPSADGEIIVPEVIVGADGDGRHWLTVFDGVPARPASGPANEIDRVIDVDRVIDQVLSRVRDLQLPPGSEPTELRLRSNLRPEEWRDQIVGRARALIRSGELDKCVLARELTVEADAPFAPATVIDRLARTFPAANLFLVDGFFGASPELLVARLDDVVLAHPLAGTLPRSTDPERDRTLAAELLVSDKNRWEHRITIDWLLDNLLPFCSYVDAEPEPSIVSLANVHHLGTKVEGRLSSPAASVLELVGALHPTPAVGGDPQKAALDLIAEIERADRGRYGGPTGWVDASGNGEFAVGIRSAQLERPDRVRLFAGVGVVGDSDLQAELDETRAKFQAILGALIRL